MSITNDTKRKTRARHEDDTKTNEDRQTTHEDDTSTTKDYARGYVVRTIRH